MYFCAGWIENPWRKRNRGRGRVRNAHRFHHDYVPPFGAPAPAPQVVPARVARVPPVVDVPDDGDSGVSGVSAQTPRVRLRPKHKAMPGKPKPKAMPSNPTPKPKVKAKPKAPAVSDVAGVVGAKRKNSRSPSGRKGNQKTPRLEAASASSAPSHSGVSTRISLKQPLLGETFTIYSAGRCQASDTGFQSPS